MNSQITSRRRWALTAVLMVVPACTALADSDCSFKGIFDAQDLGVPAGPTTVLINGTGGGTASHFGRFQYFYQITLDFTKAQSAGTIQLVAANGDMIDGSSVGFGMPTDNPNVTHVIEHVKVTGGTGRFQGATGYFTIDRLLDDSKLPIGLTSGSFCGVINTSRHDK